MLEAAGGPGKVTQAALAMGMTGASLDIEATGVDRDSGAGIVMAPGAVDAVDVAAADRNEVPTATGTLSDQTLDPEGDAITIDLAGKFSDPENETLTYAAVTGDDRVEISITDSELTVTPGPPTLAEVVVRAVDPHGLSGVRDFSVTVSVGDRDYDTDNDNLIDVSTPAQLDAIRYDLNGNGLVDGTNWQPYYDAFGMASVTMGCSDRCIGYELRADLDFDTNGNGGDGWIPIGGDGTTTDGTTLRLQNPFHAIFEGNGHTIGNLFIETDTIVLAGLFGYARSRSSIRNLGLIDVDATGSELVAGLVGFNNGEIRGSYVTGRISGVENVGGLVGINSFFGGIHGSYSTSQVSGDDDDVGGLVGNNKSTGEITAGYATGPVSGDSDLGGLVGRDHHRQLLGYDDIRLKFRISWRRQVDRTAPGSPRL